MPTKPDIWRKESTVRKEQSGVGLSRRHSLNFAIALAKFAAQAYAKRNQACQSGIHQLKLKKNPKTHASFLLLIGERSLMRGSEVPSLSGYLWRYDTPTHQNPLK